MKKMSKQVEDFFVLSKSEVDFEKYRNKAIFITGATGLIGSSLVKGFFYCNRILELNLRIVAAVRNLEKAHKVYKDFLNSGELEIYLGDITNPILYESDVDYIFHTASVTASKEMVDNPVKTIETSYQGTKQVLELAKKKSAEVVYVSSMEVYGIPDANLSVVKEADLGYIDLRNVRSSYSEGKRICECLCTAYAAEYNLSIKVARLAQTFGPGVLKEDNRVYAQFARCILEKKDIVLHTDGTSEGNYCYIRDAIKALMILAYAGKKGEAYNIVNENTHMQIKEMAELVVNEIGNKEIKVLFDIPESEKKYGYAPSVKMKLSGEKMRRLGWNPEVDLKEMYERMIDDMKRSGV